MQITRQCAVLLAIAAFCLGRWYCGYRSWSFR